MVMGEWIRTAHPELAGTMVSTWLTAATRRRSICVCVNEPAGARDMRYGGVVGGAYRGLALPSSASAEVKQTWSDRIKEINNDPAFQKKMIDGGFALLDIDADGMAAFMEDRVEEYLTDARKAGLIK